MKRERIDKLLVERGLAESRTKAQALVMAGVVLVNEQRVEKPSDQFATDAPIRVKRADDPASRYVGRGGVKLEAAKLLIERGADVNAPSILGIAPLVPAVRRRNIELIKLLLDHGANPNSVLGTQTALHLAVQAGCFDCVKALVEAGADVNAVTSNGQYRTPLHIAKLRGLGEVADYLLMHGVIIPKPEPISPKLAAADVQKGQVVFEANCGFCHSAKPKERKVGPSLWVLSGTTKRRLPR